MQHQPKTIQPSTIFGLRYLEEEAFEVMEIAGCTAAPTHVAVGGTSDNDPGTTHYTTNCDVSDTDSSGELP